MQSAFYHCRRIFHSDKMIKCFQFIEAEVPIEIVGYFFCINQNRKKLTILPVDRSNPDAQHRKSE